MSNIYLNGSYLKINPTWHEEDSPWKAKQIKKIIDRNKLDISTICEVGCGPGEILNQLSFNLNKDIRYFGYEISPQAFEICKRKSKHNLTFSNKNILKEKNASYDVLLIIDVIEHVEDYIGFIKQIKSKAKYKIFHIPLELSVQTILRAYPIMNSRCLYGHIHFFTKEIVIANLTDSGYQIKDLFYTRGMIELSNLKWKQKILKLPRKVFYSINKDLTVRTLGGFSLLVLAE
jgi:SAM-dependent methyltransferase